MGKGAAAKKTKTTKSDSASPNTEDIIIEEDDTEEQQGDSISKNYLEKTLKQLESSLQKGYNKTIEKLNDTIDSLTQTLNNTKKHCEKLEQEVRQLREEKTKLASDIKAANANIRAVEERVEERTNRQLRKTLVFRGIPEAAAVTANDSRNSSTSSADTAPTAAESWEASKKKIAEAIANVSDITAESAVEMVERAHRSAPNPRYKGTAPRPIFAAIYKWPDAETIVDAFRKFNIANPESKVSCDYKYGPMTTKRRSMAFLERKKLKETGEIVAGYVAYPARLMVKRSKRDGSKYVCLKDFSREPVSFGKRD